MTLARGTKIVQYELASADRDEVLDGMLGRTGNLRAPVIRVGAHLYVGFPRDGFPGLT
ncbi:MAG: hypothetical protein H6713_31655 [Myxococcales bacterium]|nr:hypothetical protein [Myxococcales bacterium]MCB9754516.1 hypothetical protein [Myxococcales bacterium]